MDDSDTTAFIAEIDSFVRGDSEAKFHPTVHLLQP
jgi:hypothetical protein